jgi:hypothetical protein
MTQTRRWTKTTLKRGGGQKNRLCCLQLSAQVTSAYYKCAIYTRSSNILRIDKTVSNFSARNHMVEVLYGFHLTHYRKQKECLLYEVHSVMIILVKTYTITCRHELKPGIRRSPQEERVWSSHKQFLFANSSLPVKTNPTKPTAIHWLETASMSDFLLLQTDKIVLQDVWSLQTVLQQQTHTHTHANVPPDSQL